MKVCPKCGTQNDDSSNFCSNCAAPLAGATPGPTAPVPEPPRKKKKPLLKKWWFWAIIVLIIIIAIAGSSGNKDKDNSSISSNPTATSEAGQSEQSASIPAETETASENATAPYEATLTSGNYTAGTDFPAGTYDIEAISGTGNVSSTNIYSGGINAMMGEEGSESYYQQSYSNILLPEGTRLSVSGGVTITISSDSASAAPLTARNQAITETVNLENGNFVAGTDFPAGVYDIDATSGSGNVSSDNMYDGGLNAMMGTSGSPFEAEYKNIDLPEGTTLTISGVNITLTPSK